LGLNRFDDFVSIHFAAGKQLEHEQLGHAIQKIGVGRSHSKDNTSKFEA
jgi:hypothetical protein